MTDRPQSSEPLNRRKAVRTVVMCVSIVSVMTALAFASVPLYDLFCRVTGFGGTPLRADAGADTVLDRQISIRFDSNVAAGLGWDFRPKEREVTINVGANGLAFYVARNTRGHDTTGTATFNVTPNIAGQYFVKVECFCFQEQTLAPGEAVDMPVAFYIDPAIVDDPDLKNLPQITLSYTFFEVDEPEERTVSQAGEQNAPAGQVGSDG